MRLFRRGELNCSFFDGRRAPGRPAISPMKPQALIGNCLKKILFTNSPRFGKESQQAEAGQR